MPIKPDVSDYSPKIIFTDYCRNYPDKLLAVYLHTWPSNVFIIIVLFFQKLLVRDLFCGEISNNVVSLVRKLTYLKSIFPSGLDNRVVV